MKFVTLPNGKVINPKMVVKLEYDKDFVGQWQTIITMVDGSYFVLHMSMNDVKEMLER